MSQPLICPQCGNKLKIEHYDYPHKSGAMLYMSRLICTAPCLYRKEAKLPKELFSEINKKDVYKDLDS